MDEGESYRVNLAASWLPLIAAEFGTDGKDPLPVAVETFKEEE